MMKRSKSLEHRQQSLIEEKSSLLKNIEETDSLKIYPLEYHASRLVTFDGVSISYGNRRIVSNVSFDIERGDRIALCGKNGSGKSSVIKLICGEDVAHTGNVYKGKTLIISRVFQDTAYLRGNLTAFAKESGIDESLFKAILRKLDFSRAQFDKDMADFSGGQKNKVLVAKSLCERAHLYIWDEPLNFIDVLSRMQIEELLLRYKPTMLFVEHDTTFTDIIATKRVEL
jgi:lincosamide and streptogramin A transport system ATP-binding/permease protein